MNRSSASESHQSASLRVLEHEQSTVAGRQRCTTVAEAESSSAKLKTPNWNNGASCRKLKLGTVPRTCTGLAAKTAVGKSPKLGHDVQTGAVRQLSNWSSNSTPVSNTTLSCKSTSSYGSQSAQSFVSRPSSSIYDQWSASSLNAATSVDLTTSTCLQSTVDAASCCQSEQDVTVQPSEHIHNQHFLCTSNASSPAGSTGSSNSSSCAKRTINYASGCIPSTLNDSIVNPSPSYRYVTQESACSKTQTSVGCKVGSVSKRASKRAHNDATCLLQAESKPVSQPAKTNTGQERSKPTVSHASLSERLIAVVRRSASGSKTKTPVNCPESVNSVSTAKSTGNDGKRCVKSVQLVAHTTPETITPQSTGCSTPFTSSYGSHGLKSSVDATVSSEYTANSIKLSGIPASECPKPINSRKAAVIARPPVYYSSGQRMTGTPSSSERDSKINLSTDSVCRKTSKPDSDVIAKAVPLQPNSGVTKKKVKKSFNKKSSTLAKNLLEVYGDKTSHGAAKVIKPGAFVPTFKPVFTPASARVFSHRQHDVINEEVMDTSESVTEVIVTQRYHGSLKVVLSSIICHTTEEKEIYRNSYEAVRKHTLVVQLMIERI